MSDFLDGLLSRESEIIRIIKVFSQNNLDFVVVGGYAVSTYKKRFSVDLDIVIKESDAAKFENLLEKENYSPSYSKEIHTLYSEKFKRLEKKVGDLTVNVDLLINGLVSRCTNGAWSFETIFKNSVKRNLQGASFLTPVKELIIAMKIHSGRFSDIRDIVALYENVELSRILKYVKRGDMDKLKNRLDKEIKFLESPNFKDSFKGIFGFHAFNEAVVENAKKGLEKLLSEL